MTTFFLYLMKSVLCLALFYPFYMVLLSRETFHRFNRMALISILLASAVIPACRITTEEPLLLSQLYQRWEHWLTGQEAETTAAVADMEWADMDFAAMAVAEDDLLEVAPAFSLGDFLSNNWGDLLFLLYVAGILFLLVRHAASLVRLFGLLRLGRMLNLGDGTRLYLHPQSDIAPFSWMKYIVISETDYEENGRQIVAHEQAHISNGHSWDLLLVELCLLAQWFNPAAWLLRQELQNIHEYEADDTVLRRGINAKEYQLLIIKKAVGARLYSLANSLNHSSLKKRLTMMMKEKSHPWARLKYLYVLPLAAISMVAFAHTEAANNSNGVSEAKITEFSVNNQTFGANSSENEKILIVVDGKLTVQDAKPTDWTNEDLAKRIGITPEEIAQIEVIKKPEVLAQWNVPEATGAILITTKNAKTDKEADHSNEKFTVVVNDAGEYSYGPMGGTLKKGSLDDIADYITKEREKLMAAGGGQYFVVNVKVSPKAPEESVDKVKETLRKVWTLRITYDLMEEDVFQVVEEMPEFPGGMNELMKFLSRNIKYPVEAQQKGEQGRVIVQFTVDKGGKLRDFEVKRSISPALDAEAIRVCKAMPDWKPGKQRGEAVSVKFTIPISFRLQGTKGNPGEEVGDLRVLSEGKIKAVYDLPREQVVNNDIDAIQVVSMSKPGQAKAMTEDKSGRPAAKPIPTDPVKDADGDEVFMVVEKMPEFPGGTAELMKFLQKNMKYPKEAHEKGEQGRVMVQFVIKKTGEVANATVVRSVSPALDAEALRVVNSMPKWAPGEQKGKAVSVKFTLPMQFKLQGDKAK